MANTIHTDESHVFGDQRSVSIIYSFSSNAITFLNILFFTRFTQQQYGRNDNKLGIGVNAIMCPAAHTGVRTQLVMEIGARLYADQSTNLYNLFVISSCHRMIISELFDSKSIQMYRSSQMYR